MMDSHDVRIQAYCLFPGVVTNHQVTRLSSDDPTLTEVIESKVHDLVEEMARQLPIEMATNLTIDVFSRGCIMIHRITSGIHVVACLVVMRIPN